MDNLKSTAEAFLLAVSGRNIREGYDRYTGEGFKHHNVYYKGDADSLRKGMEENHELYPDMKFEIKRLIGEGNIVVAHSYAQMKPDEPGYALIHMFRFENGKIVEMWDLGQQVPAEMINENGPF